jgi:molybdopterin converting factor subunit 1
MKVKVLAFGIAKDIFGGASIEADINVGTTATLKHVLEATYPRLKQLASYMVAVNSEYAQEDTPLTERDEIAIIPPVSGG